MKSKILGLGATVFLTLLTVLVLRHIFPPPEPITTILPPPPGQAKIPPGEKRWDGKVNIGYFHGGRTIILYRTKIFREFEKAGLDVELMTRFLRSKNYFPMPDLTVEKKISNVGKATGDELIRMVVNGTFQGATVGETAFLRAVREGAPIVAVAELGHDVKDGAGHALVLRKGVTLKGSDSLRGLRFGARRSAGGDEVVLREFITQHGLDPDKDVKLISNINDDVFGSMLAKGQLDGAYGHALSIKKWLTKHKYPIYIHRPLDWIDPEMSMSVLIFHKDFVAEHPTTVQKIVLAYMRRSRTEFAMPTAERKLAGKKGLQIEMDFEGLNLPEHRRIPEVQTELLNEWQKILRKHKVLDRPLDLEPFVDNSFVKTAAEELY